MHVIDQYALTEKEADLAGASFAGIEDTLFGPDDHERTKDLRWLTHQSGPIGRDRLDEVIATVATAIIVLDAQADPAHWTPVATAMGATDISIAEGLAQSRSRLADRARALHASMTAAASPVPVPDELADADSLAALYYEGLDADEIAARADTTVAAVARAMRTHGIRSRADLLADRDWLHRTIAEHGIDGTATRIGTSPGRIRRAISTAG